MATVAETPVQAAEILAALSLATDLGSGQPLEHALRTCLLASALGRAAGVSGEELGDAYDLALLHGVGCTADAHEAAIVYGDDIAGRADWAPVDGGRPLEVLAFLRRRVGAGRPPLERLAFFAATLPAARAKARAGVAAHCEVAQRLAPRLGIGPRPARALAFVFERWDGRGFPAGVCGEAIPLPMRVVHIARDADVLHRLGGGAGMLAAVAARAGSAYDPELAARSSRSRATPSQRSRRARPGTLSSPRLPAAGRRSRASASTRPAPPSAISPTSHRPSLHPHHTERALARSPGLARLGELAGTHHERLDGRGYHRGLAQASLSQEARLLAAADRYSAMGRRLRGRGARAARRRRADPALAAALRRRLGRHLARRRGARGRGRAPLHERGAS